jgi:hypothetical protein
LRLDTPFWRTQCEGLALFITPYEFYWYQLPLAPSELVVVGRRFHLKPLLPLLGDDGAFYLLAFSQNRVRFFQGTRWNLTELAPKNTPKNLAETLRYDEFEKQHQFHTAAPGGRGRMPAIFHGHGATARETDRELERYCRQIDQGLYPCLKDQKAPLIVACVDLLFPTYQAVNHYPHLYDQVLAGNPDKLASDVLHRQAWQHLQPYFQEKLTAAVTRYNELRATWRTANQFEAILPAAFQGQVEQLFLAVDQQRWGRFDPQTTEIVYGEATELGIEELLDLAAVQTLRLGGTVHAVAKAMVPDGGEAAAIFRY